MGEPCRREERCCAAHLDSHDLLALKGKQHSVGKDGVCEFAWYSNEQEGALMVQHPSGGMGILLVGDNLYLG